MPEQCECVSQKVPDAGDRQANRRPEAITSWLGRQFAAEDERALASRAFCFTNLPGK